MISKVTTGHRYARCPVCIRTTWIIIGMCIAGFFLGSLISLHILRIDATKQGHTVFIHTISPGDTFATRYLHSVELCHVWEYFKIDEQYNIVLYGTTFSSCNTGLPVSLAEQETLHHEDMHFRISNMHRMIPRLSLWVHDKYDNMLKIGDADGIDLAALAGNVLLEITIQSVTMLEYACMKAKILVSRFTRSDFKSNSYLEKDAHYD